VQRHSERRQSLRVDLVHRCGTTLTAHPKDSRIVT
jgi:hypothetical protein